MTDSNLPRFNSEELLERYLDPHKINHFLDLIEQANKKINIVSRETSRVKLLSLAADCLVPREFGIDLRGEFFDIGPGGGFPSVVLMLADERLRGTLIERTKKKAEFLGIAIEELNLTAKVIAKDFAEAASSLPYRHYAFGTMKYVRIDRRILNGVAAIVRPGGAFLYYSRFEDADLSIPHLFPVKSFRYYLDDPENVRTLTVFSLESR